MESCFSNVILFISLVVFATQETPKYHSPDRINNPPLQTIHHSLFPSMLAWASCWTNSRVAVWNETPWRSHTDICTHILHAYLYYVWLYFISPSTLAKTYAHRISPSDTNLAVWFLDWIRDDSQSTGCWSVIYCVTSLDPDYKYRINSVTNISHQVIIQGYGSTICILYNRAQEISR